jgi:hypothetical protein
LINAFPSSSPPAHQWFLKLALLKTELWVYAGQRSNERGARAQTHRLIGRPTTSQVGAAPIHKGRGGQNVTAPLPHHLVVLDAPPQVRLRASAAAAASLLPLSGTWQSSAAQLPLAAASPSLASSFWYAAALSRLCIAASCLESGLRHHRPCLVWLALVLVRFSFTAAIERTHTECEDAFCCFPTRGYYGVGLFRITPG